MKKEEFRNYLVNVLGRTSKTARDYISNAGRIEKWYGNLDELTFEGMNSILEELTDALENNGKGHRIPIDRGNPYDITQNLATTLRRYMEFSKYMELKA